MGALTTVGNFFYCGPTYGQVKRIAWDDIKAMTGPYWEKDPSESDMIVFLRNGSRIYLLGMDEPSRIEGMQWHGGVLDEYADMKPSVWPSHVQPATADTNAWVDFIGVPEGRNHYYELFQAATISNEWGAYTWISADVLAPEAIARAKATLDERSYRTEYEASFEQAGLQAYHAFDEYSLSDAAYRPGVDTYMCWDFNAGEKPMATTLVQLGADGLYHAVAEFLSPYTNTEAQCERIDDWIRERGLPGNLFVAGDHAGKRAESSASWSDYEIIEQRFKAYPGYTVKFRPTLKIRDRVASLNAMMRTADGTRRLKISRNCPKLIEDLQKVEWKENGVQLNDRDPRRTHISDALSYWAYNYHAIDRTETTTYFS